MQNMMFCKASCFSFYCNKTALVFKINQKLVQRVQMSNAQTEVKSERKTFSEVNMKFVRYTEQYYVLWPHHFVA